VHATWPGFLYLMVLRLMQREFWTDITMAELKAFFRRNDILTSSNINDIVRMKKAREKEAELRKQQGSPTVHHVLS
jgi:hypothetical protein